jgi:probable rRNA maturation factor
MIIIDLFVGSRYSLDRTRLRQHAIRLLAEHKIDHAQISISIVGSRKIKELNEEKLKHQGVTDVLSFPQLEHKSDPSFPAPAGVPPHLGDIVICYPVAIATAKRYGKRVDEQIGFYLEHGILHLLGFHHDE